MERLTVIYKDNSKLKVTNRRPGVVMGYYERNIKGMSSVKSAVIQKYPKKANPAVVLVDDGNPVNSN